MGAKFADAEDPETARLPSSIGIQRRPEEGESKRPRGYHGDPDSWGAAKKTGISAGTCGFIYASRGQPWLGTAFLLVNIRDDDGREGWAADPPAQAGPAQPLFEEPLLRASTLLRRSPFCILAVRHRRLPLDHRSTCPANAALAGPRRTSSAPPENSRGETHCECRSRQDETPRGRHSFRAGHAVADGRDERCRHRRYRERGRA